MKTKSNKSGRPALLEKDKKSKRLFVRFTTEEYNEIEKLVKQSNISQSDLIRLRVLKNNQNTLLNAKEVISELNILNVELNRIGTNINQITKHVNSLALQNVSLYSSIDDFNLNFKTYLNNQQNIEIALRKIIKLLTNQK